MKESLIVNYDNPDATSSYDNEDIWLHMENEKYFSSEQYLTKSDIFAMMSMAIAGLSARVHINPNCPISVKLVDGAQNYKIELDFHVYLSHDDLEYELTSNVPEEYGEVSSPVRSRIPKSFSVVSEMSDHIDIDYRMSGFSYNWETRAYREDGTRVTAPTADLIGRVIHLSDTCFGVMRVKGNALGDKYTLTLLIPVDETSKITNIQPTVTATWTEGGEEQSKTLSITVPDCVYDSMRVCEEEIQVSVIVSDDALDRHIVWYNACDGTFLKHSKL